MVSPSKKGLIQYSKLNTQGHIHPLTQIINEVVGIFRELGFTVADGPEIEDEYHNFDALNVPAGHPARDMQDTFWLPDGKHLLRTQTSAVQVRYLAEMLKQGGEPPLRILAPGKVFRQEATDARHESQFHQIEGLLVDENVSVAHLKGYLEKFFSGLYSQKTPVRLRPSFFPFVEPGFEFDLVCIKCRDEKDEPIRGNACSLCSGAGWIEMGGAGLVHPHVFRSVGLADKKWSGFAFGIGVERLAMLKWGVEDIRIFFNGDIRFLQQF
ncbi:MAG TPA: phenylalanine--tRNA ligase subunit alpha [Candidatus Paceibacterota bacterium]|nr:phenylalanine--tRNA ligase subunit alpha [Candidatus Paceibacterota bacterium]HPN89181.1 phenylalanine--tRNA ligase subunit alpha [Candidatus Paceibacterota bacterium]